jgi:hypothetical protein
MILVYRDGVGDGQIAHVVNTEVPQILNTFKAAGTAYK